MQWLRSYPYPMPEGRRWIVDPNMDHLFMGDYDYSALRLLQDDICLLEWDMAVAREDMRRFEEHAAANPGCVLVAPYRLYEGHAAFPVYAHRLVYSGGAERWVTGPEDARCDYFGFGMIYLPHQLVAEFCAADPATRAREPHWAEGQDSNMRGFTDHTFSVWHRHQKGRDVAIDWSVCPVHLHY